MKFLRRQNTQNQLWSVINSFTMWRLPHYIQQCLQMMWSFGEGSDSEVLANRGGVQIGAPQAWGSRVFLKPLSIFLPPSTRF
jgi:hypothetical protein